MSQFGLTFRISIWKMKFFNATFLRFFNHCVFYKSTHKSSLYSIFYGQKKFFLQATVRINTYTQNITKNFSKYIKLYRKLRVRKAHWGKNQLFIQKLPRIWCLKNVNFVQNETLKLWILWKMKLWKCEFCEK